MAKEKIEEDNQEINLEEGKTKKEGLRKKQNKQIFIAIFLMAFVVIMVIGVPYIARNYVYKFTYINLDFNHYKLGKVDFYSTRIPLVDSNGNISAFYTMDFRSDPRKLEYIPFVFSSGGNQLEFVRGKKLYISTPPGLKPCELNFVAVANLASFLRGMGQPDVKGATSDEKYAKETNMTYANCDSYPNNTVILIKNGTETKIEKTAKNCYELTYANCEIIQVAERFDLIILEPYMDNFEKK